MAKREKRNGQGQLAARPRPRHALPMWARHRPRVAPGPSTCLAPESSHGLDTTQACRQADGGWTCPCSSSSAAAAAVAAHDAATA